MNVMVIGSGAREHAMLWKLSQSHNVSKLFAAPGNGGTQTIATNIPVHAEDIHALADTTYEYSIDLTIVGPEAPLAAGIVDHFNNLGIPIFGPTKAAAQIESSKVFSKKLMQRYGIPTAHGQTFDSYGEAAKYIAQQAPPMVVKADGLAAGKGVTLANTHAEALHALDICMIDRAFGKAGDQVIVEETLIGREVSVFAFTDGVALSPLIAACDYKRAYDADKGPNTGGMGSYSPPEFWTPKLAIDIEEQILIPTLEAMDAEGTPYRGVLYAGLILTEGGPKVIEFNCRLGDPESQAILPRMNTDLLDVILAVLNGTLDQLEIRWMDDACVSVVLACDGYPGEYQTGMPIDGLDNLVDDKLVFHAGTSYTDRRWITTGGRVLTVVSLGSDLAQARQKVYSIARSITFPGVFYRRDVARVKRG